MPKTKSKSKQKNMREHATELADKLAPHVESAREKAAPVIADAKEKAAPMVSEAREKAAPALAEVREKLTTEVLPVITAAIAAASEATEDVRGEAKKRGKATKAALKGEVEAPKKKHRVRRFFVVLGLGGIAAAVAKMLSDRQATTAWQSSYTPTPPSTPVDDTPTATAAAAATARRSETDDEGASAPDEAASDATDSPHRATTPDNPAEEVTLDKE